MKSKALKRTLPLPTFASKKRASRAQRMGMTGHQEYRFPGLKLLFGLFVQSPGYP
jgi:hypothetical protein